MALNLPGNETGSAGTADTSTGRQEASSNSTASGIVAGLLAGSGSSSTRRAWEEAEAHVAAGEASVDKAPEQYNVTHVLCLSCLKEIFSSLIQQGDRDLEIERRETLAAAVAASVEEDHANAKQETR